MSVTTPPQSGTDQNTDAQMFGPYRLEQRIGRGGMGEVFRAYDTSRQRTVALKRLHAGVAGDEEYSERFRRESRLAARLSSPHVIPIHDFGTIDGQLFIDMRLVSGKDLSDEIQENGPLEPTRVARIVRQLADALDAAHEDGLVHRDVKPSNVLLTRQRGRDFLYLVDFGIVRTMNDGGSTRAAALTGTGLTIGTLAYMAPEVFVGRDIDRGVDVYALGCLIVEALTGRPPFVGEGPTLMFEHLNAVPPRLTEISAGLPPALDPVIAKALAKSPAERYATAGDLADACYLAITGTTGTGPSPTAEAATTVSPTGAAAGMRPATGAAAAGSGPSVRYVASSGPEAAAPTAWSPQAPTGATGGPAMAPPMGPGMSAPMPFTTGGYPPPTGALPGQPAPAQPAPKRSRTGLWIALGAGAALLAVVVLLAVIGMSSGARTAAPGGAPSAGAPGASGLAAAFPDISTLGSACTPFQPGPTQYVTSTGARPVSVVRCSYASQVPGAVVVYVQWPTAADAQQWERDQMAQGPSLDGIDQWSVDNATAGDLHTRQGTDGMVYATANYTGKPYSYDIATPTLDGSNQMFGGVMHLLSPSQLPTS